VQQTLDMPYPNLENTYRHAALFAPQEFLAYLQVAVQTLAV
jgi:hypothetical protein